MKTLIAFSLGVITVVAATPPRLSRWASCVAARTSSPPGVHGGDVVAPVARPRSRQRIPSFLRSS